MDLHLKNKVALVTGGSRGLGEAICFALAAEGANVAVNYAQNSEKGNNVAETIKEKYGTAAIAIRGDVSKYSDVAEMFDAAESSLGEIDILVNNAGVWPKAYVRDMTEEDWDRTLGINLKGPFLTCRQAVRRWLKSKCAGRIVNISSPAAFSGSTTGHAHYAASKAGLVAFTKSLAREVASEGICVNTVVPGMMTTDMANDALEKNMEGYLNRIPSRRIGKPEEIANVVAFLSSDRTNYMTGATMNVSGGMLMR